jgi:pyruvate/2-oxoglutarate dehydrogenase complex dihydrolipoamide dehydrogenase (E3) component
MIVIGAGPIGVEMSQAFARFGTKVHLLEAAGQILIREDQDAARIVEKALIEDGVNIISGCKIKKFFKRGEEKVVELECAGECQEIAVDAVLVGVGRAPNVEGMGLEEVGVEFDTRQGVTVDDTLQTTNSDILAAGDVCFQYKFTHTADALARIVIQNAIFPIPGIKKKASALTIPWCTYTEPEIAHVGMYEKDAKDAGIPITTYMHSMEEVDRAILEGDTEGFVKVHVQEGTDKIVGATIVGAHAGDMISELTLAMIAGAGLSTIAGTIHPYPTQAECIKRVGDAFNRTRLTPAAKRFFNMWLGWQR